MAACPQCRAEVHSSHKFCMQCGSPLASPARAPSSEGKAVAPPSEISEDSAQIVLAPVAAPRSSAQRKVAKPVAAEPQAHAPRPQASPGPSAGTMPPAGRPVPGRPAGGFVAVPISDPAPVASAAASQAPILAAHSKASESPATPLVQLSVCAPSAIAVGGASVLTCRLANAAARATSGVLLAESLYFRFLDRREYRISLAPGDQCEVDFELLSEQKGHCRLTLRWLTDDSHEFEGSVSLTVGDEGKSAPVIQVTDNRHTEGKFIIGQKSDLHVHVDSAAGPSGIAKAGEFLPVALRSVATTVQSRRTEESSGEKRIHRNGSSGPLLEDSRLCLRFRTGGELRNIGLLAMRRICIGKQRGRNHLVLRAHPRNGDNDLLTDRLSRHHADLEFTPQGPVWRNAECANGTVVDGQRLGRLEEAAIRVGRGFRPADAFGLHAATCAGSALGRRGAQYAEFVQRRLPGAAPPEAEVGPIHAVRIRRQDGLAATEEYVWFQTAAWIGRDSGCPIFLDDPSVAMLHALILRLGGRFWIEPQQSTHETRVGGVRVHMNELAPILPGATITLGSLEISIAEFSQFGIDF